MKDGMDEEILNAEPGKPAPVYVGGPPEPARHSLPARWISIVAGALMIGLLSLSTLWLWAHRPALTYRGVAASVAVEPASTRAFTLALGHKDPVRMREQVTQACLDDRRSVLCFGPESDARFAKVMEHRAVDVVFLRRLDGQTGVIAIYDLRLRDTVTGERSEFILVFRLSADGRIDGVLTS